MTKVQAVQNVGARTSGKFRELAPRASSDIHPDIVRLNSIFARQRRDIKAEAARELGKAALIVAATAGLMLLFWSWRK